MQTFISSAVRCHRQSRHDENHDCSYQIAWTINPHMVIGSTSITRAASQHAALIRTVRSLGAAVVQLPFVHGAFDSVFAKDNAIYAQTKTGPMALLASPRHAERRREQSSRSNDLERNGFEVRSIDATFEGGDTVILPDGRGVLLGYGFRSTLEAVPALERALGVPVFPLELVDETLFHLDTALHVMRDGTALACTTAFAPAALATLRRVLRGDIVHVAREEAARFAVNIVEVGDTIVSGTKSVAVASALAERGKSFVYTPLDEFQRAGGSAACLLGPLVHVAAQALQKVAPTAAMRSTAA